MTETTASSVARIIKRCFSPQYLEQVAEEMGEKIIPGEDIFQALLRAGRAHDMETAVALVASHLDADASPIDVPTFLREALK